MDSMKRTFVILLLAMLLLGCGSTHVERSSVVHVRDTLLSVVPPEIRVKLPAVEQDSLILAETPEGVHPRVKVRVNRAQKTVEATVRPDTVHLRDRDTTSIQTANIETKEQSVFDKSVDIIWVVLLIAVLGIIVYAVTRFTKKS